MPNCGASCRIQLFRDKAPFRARISSRRRRRRTNEGTLQPEGRMLSSQRQARTSVTGFLSLLPVAQPKREGQDPEAFAGLETEEQTCAAPCAEARDARGRRPTGDRRISCTTTARTSSPRNGAGIRLSGNASAAAPREPEGPRVRRADASVNRRPKRRAAAAFRPGRRGSSVAGSEGRGTARGRRDRS